MNINNSMQRQGRDRVLRIWTRFRFNNAPTRSPIRITLLHNKAIHIHRSQETDEGFEYETHEYILDRDDDLVYLNIYTGGSDCDGRIDHKTHLVSTVDELSSITEHSSTMFSVFRELRSETYDQNAIAAGY